MRDYSSRFPLNKRKNDFARLAYDLFMPRTKKDHLVRLKEAWQAELDALSDKKDSTKKLYSSKYREEILKIFKDNDAEGHSCIEKIFSIVKLDDETMEKVNDAYRAKTKYANLSLKVIKAHTEIVKIFTAMLKSNDMRDRAVAIIGLTGRRFSEVLKFGEFSFVETPSAGGVVRKKYAVQFSGQQKTRGAEGTMYQTTFEIPVLAPAVDIVNSFNEMRNSDYGTKWFNSTKAQLNSTYNIMLNRVLRSIMPIVTSWPVDDDLTLSSLRSLYAEIAFHYFGSRIAKPVFFANVLGHKEDDYKATLSYMVYALSDDDVAKNRAVQESVRAHIIKNDDEFESEND